MTTRSDKTTALRQNSLGLVWFDFSSVFLFFLTHSLCAAHISDLVFSFLSESLCILTLWMSPLYSCSCSSCSLKSTRAYELMWHMQPPKGLKKRITEVTNTKLRTAHNSPKEKVNHTKESPEINTHSWQAAFHLKQIKTLYFTDYS